MSLLKSLEAGTKTEVFFELPAPMLLETVESLLRSLEAGTKIELSFELHASMFLESLFSSLEAGTKAKLFKWFDTVEDPLWLLGVTNSEALTNTEPGFCDSSLLGTYIRTDNMEHNVQDRENLLSVFHQYSSVFHQYSSVFLSILSI